MLAPSCSIELRNHAAQIASRSAAERSEKSVIVTSNPRSPRGNEWNRNSRSRPARSTAAAAQAVWRSERRRLNSSQFENGHGFNPASGLTTSAIKNSATNGRAKRGAAVLTAPARATAGYADRHAYRVWNPRNLHRDA